MTLLILGFFTFVLVLLSAYLLLIILMQKASSNAGMGATLGGGAAESALGGGAGNVLTKGTIWGVSLFFVIAFGLYLGHMGAYVSEADRDGLPGLRGIEGEADPVRERVTPSSLTDIEIEAETDTDAAPAAPAGEVTDAPATESSDANPDAE